MTFDSVTQIDNYVSNMEHPIEQDWRNHYHNSEYTQDVSLLDASTGTYRINGIIPIETGLDSFVRNFRSAFLADFFDISPAFVETSEFRIIPNPVDLERKSYRGDELPLDSHFVPNDQVLRLWVKALNSISKEANDGPTRAKSYNLSRDKKLLRLEFNKRLMGALARYALMKSYESNVFRLSVENRFVYSFESIIYQAFLVTPSDATPFFTNLFGDISIWLARGRELGGAWGRLEVDETGDFSMKLNRRKKQIVRGFKPANIRKLL
jgi:hypothetical protein